MNELLKTNVLLEMSLSLLLALGLTGLIWLLTTLYIDPNYTLSTLELIGVIFNFACVYLTIKENNWAWLLGIVGALALGLLFYNLELYSSMILSLFFFLPAQFYGLWNWMYGNEGKRFEIQKYFDIKYEPNKRLIYLSIASVAIFYPIYLYFIQLSGAAFPMLDSLILVFSIVAQLLLAHKLPVSWLFWILVNTISVYVYFQSGALAIALQYVVFWVHAIYGWWRWSNLAKDS